MRPPFEPRGVIPAALLPFTPDYAIDPPAFSQHLQDLAAVNGVTAITVNGHSCEIHALTFEEQRRVLSLSREAVGDKMPLVAGIYTGSSLEAARLAAMAQAEGADALLIFPPESAAMGGQLRPEMATLHLRHITDASDLPLILFQYPMATGLGYPFDTLLELCRTFPNICAIKDWCNDPVLHERHIRALHGLERPVNVLTTHSAWLFSSLVLGCDGLLSGAGSVIAPLQTALFHAVQAGDLAKARLLHDQMYPVTSAFYRPPLLDMHNRMKEALVLQKKIPRATVRPPLAPLPAEEIISIREALRLANLRT